MSAYVVEDECINSIVTWLTNPHHSWERRQVEEALALQGTIGDTFEEQLGTAMFELNCNAVEQRYGDGQAKEFRPLDYKWVPNHYASGYATYDRLGEYIYQCSEGDVPESSKLYDALNRVYAQMAHTFFRDLRERKQEREREDYRECAERIAKLEALFSKKRRA